MPDHIHILVKIPPKMSVSNFMGYLKGKSSLMIFERFANLKYKFGNKFFWTKRYYVSTVGLDTKKGTRVHSRPRKRRLDDRYNVYKGIR